MDDFGPDGTQPLPPPRLFPDALAGLVTGEASAFTQVEPPVVVVVPPVVVEPPVVHARRGSVRRQAPRPTPLVPVALAPHAALPAEPKKGRGALAGCLIGLVVLAGLLFNVLREIIEAVAELLR
ncbi:hypothetical protein [Saccharothrix lopnurensis]|uniref:Uncharacterized protein n=1 Tax=Saccharothrix lopnurensis TaxID=1670621 RepID=A0ABW1NZF6_9PSEU